MIVAPTPSNSPVANAEANGMNPSEFDYLERPKQFERNDFWRQVRRTVNGQPVSDAQIQLIAEQIRQGLGLQSGDSLLDVGCGNGALTAWFETSVDTTLGVDRSAYLIDIAKQHFESPRLRFAELSIEQMIAGGLQSRHNKALLYGVSSYLSDELLEALVRWYFEDSDGCLFIGNVRDERHANEFYKQAKSAQELGDHTTSIGKWRTQDWFVQLAQQLGLRAAFMKMPPAFYLSSYYFDVVLTRR